MSDPYYAIVEEQWSNILALYDQFEDKKPIMLFDVQEQRIYCYPYEGFKDDLNPRNRALLEDMYRKAIVDSHIVVFVRDNDERRLVSYSVNPGDRPRNYRKKRSMRAKASREEPQVHPVGDAV